jgi:hypothetical protein
MGWLAGVASAAAFVVTFFLRMNAVYGPFNLSVHVDDWVVLWELLRHGQIALRVVVQSAVLGTAAAAVPWVVVGLATRWRETR